MGLKRAIELLPCDRGTQSALRDVITFFTTHAGEWYEFRNVAEMSGVADEEVDRVLKVLCSTFVLDCSGAPLRYRFEGDRSMQFEIEGFLRRADRRSGVLQTNVERFRERYGR